MNLQLAKKYNPDKIPASPDGYYVTEKLDGNRGIAEFFGGEWHFLSRSGKPININFDMSTFDKSRIYDGEIISRNYLANRKTADFNALNGLINSGKDKSELIFAIFDILNDRHYLERRAELDAIPPTSNAFVLPSLAHFPTADALRAAVPALLADITDKGGEGLMINSGSAPYQHKRTSDLLKVKNVYSMDLEVVDIEVGSGKCAGMVGALKCECETTEGKKIITDVGTGFPDALRRAWLENPDLILGKIIEASYFEVTQAAEKAGTNIYSLRFPRFTRLRPDKSTTSEY